MKTIKWETLKRRASRDIADAMLDQDNMMKLFTVYAFDEAIFRNSSTTFTGLSSNGKENGSLMKAIAYIQDTIHKWDVRCVKNLLILMEDMRYPLLPKNKTEKVYAEINEDDQWVICYDIGDEE